MLSQRGPFRVNAHVLSDSLLKRARAFYALTKPRVVSLIVFTAVIGMFLAAPGMVAPRVLLAGTFGIALVAGAAAAVNCLVEKNVDALMLRTRWRPLPSGELSSLQTLAFAGVVGGLGLWLLVHYVNALTMWLTLATFVGYAVVYTVILKPRTPQNIVIGGASGAMPPVLGWTAVTGEVTTEAMLLFSSSLPGRRRTSGRWRSTAPRTTRAPGCRCCRSRTARATRACRCCSTRWSCSACRCCPSPSA
jgi:protoheme IX farnesyltransferase